MELTKVAQLEEIVGKSPAPRDLKVIDYIDEHAQRWLSYSHFAFVAFGKLGNIRLSAVGGDEGFVSVLDAKHLQFSLSAFDEEGVVEQNVSFGSLFIVSGMDETLRINGTVSHILDGLVTLLVEECYLHCAKAFRRSNFWQPEVIEHSNNDISAFFQRSTFLVLASMNNNGQVDVSPKGDPENFLIQEEGDCILFADRPGNRRIDSFRNIIEQPHICVMAIAPGCQDMLEINGSAVLCTDLDLLDRFTVKGKRPKLVTKISSGSKAIKPSMAIAKAALWPAKGGCKELNPAEIFKAHIKHSKESSLKAKLARAAVSLPGAFEAGLELDYKNNMY
ncbi:pyridoxamine 5'-phosphate oxidase family protein [Zhongshania guokunii]|uniref:Pyridoxamine 5'-phosphate oxidase family protein n=1 Tax=Zhongshania guokunii TaxID=641783 RepID=A0ABV3U9E6_9GAMM